MPAGIGRILIVLGVVLLAAGLWITLGARLPFRLGRLPGDIVIHGKHTTFYFPLVTSILLSAVGTLLLWLVSRRGN